MVSVGLILSRRGLGPLFIFAYYIYITCCSRSSRGCGKVENHKLKTQHRKKKNISLLKDLLKTC